MRAHLQKKPSKTNKTEPKKRQASIIDHFGQPRTKKIKLPKLQALEIVTGSASATVNSPFGIIDDIDNVIYEPEEESVADMESEPEPEVEVEVEADAEVGVEFDENGYVSEEYLADNNPPEKDA
jgi:hypothetical protein